jgi:ABC-2 type transport system ATP-binding protein
MMVRETSNEEADFWSSITEKYDRVVDLQTGTATRSVVRERLAEEARLGHLVEFGCGTGFFTGVLAGKADTLVATDISPGMLEAAKQQINAPNVTFQVEDCRSTSLPTATFDAAFIAFVLQFTGPERTLPEIHRILKPGGLLIIANPDPAALSGLDYVRGVFRILRQGHIGYRVAPPKRLISATLKWLLGRSAMTEKGLCERLAQSGFGVVSVQTLKDSSRSSNIPVKYIRAAKS